MSQLSPYLRDTEDNGLVFLCPGCKTNHIIYHGEGKEPRWTWNGDVNKPTFTPSILTKYSKMTPLGHEQYEEWKNNGYPSRDERFDSEDVVCHSFITDGMIQYLTDCTHKLSGQTIPMVHLLD